MREQFYIVLSSKNSMYVFPENKTTHFTTQLPQSIILAHEKALSKTIAKYPLTRVEVKAITMHSGIHEGTLDNVILGQLPKRIIVGFVENKAFNGDKNLNPFNFKNFHINYLCLH